MIRTLLGLIKNETNLGDSLNTFETCGICNFKTGIPLGTPKEDLGKKYLEGIGPIHSFCYDPLYSKVRLNHSKSHESY